MIDFFNTLHSGESGALPVTTHESIAYTNSQTTNIFGGDIKATSTHQYSIDVAVVGSNLQQRPTNLVETLQLDVVGPDSPPRPK